MAHSSLKESSVMRTCCTLLALWAGLGLGPAALAQPTAPAREDAERVEQLIKQLSSTKFAEREKATKEIEALGSAALEPLRKAARGEDPEARMRAAKVLKALEEKVAAADLLAPTRVRLVCKDTP